MAETKEEVSNAGEAERVGKPSQEETDTRSGRGHEGQYAPNAPGSDDKRFFIGVYYFPGWKDNQAGAAYAKPWDKIKPYPEREPALGWYVEGDVGVASQQADWMEAHGIDFVAFDTYWGTDNRPYLEHALRAHMRSGPTRTLKWAVLWANHGGSPGSVGNFEAMVRYWRKEYFAHPRYLRIDGKPVVFVFSVAELRQQATALGVQVGSLLSRAQDIIREDGLSGIYFVGGTAADPSVVRGQARKDGFAALSAYNYHGGFSGQSESYEELSRGYGQQWRWILRESDIPYFVPMTSGWDKRPWGGSRNPKHDLSSSTPETFEAHLTEAKRLMMADPMKSRGIGLICCWNEFGEGSYIEPTKKWGTKYLEAIRRVFRE